MKNHFLRLFNYDHYANTLIVGLIGKSGNPDASVKLMAHLLASQQVWYHRCADEKGIAPDIWPEGNPENFDEIINNANQKWTDFLNNLEDKDFEREIKYKNSKGEAFNNRLVDILGHVINHGTHHRAQIGQLLKSAGTELPFTDYIIYVRNLN